MSRVYVKLVSATPVEAPVPGFPSRIAAIEFFTPNAPSEQMAFHAIKTHRELPRCKVVLSEPCGGIWDEIGALAMAPVGASESAHSVTNLQLAFMRNCDCEDGYPLPANVHESRKMEAIALRLRQRGLVTFEGGAYRLTADGRAQVDFMKARKVAS